MNHMQEIYNMFNHLSADQQEAAIQSFGLSAEDQITFRTAMAFMKLFNDRDHYEAVKHCVAHMLYTELSK